MSERFVLIQKRHEINAALERAFAKDKTIPNFKAQYRHEQLKWFVVSAAGGLVGLGILGLITYFLIN